MASIKLVVYKGNIKYLRPRKFMGHNSIGEVFDTLMEAYNAERKPCRMTESRDAIALGGIGSRARQRQ